jgi:acyl-CoA thioester hydrolase
MTKASIMTDLAPLNKQHIFPIQLRFCDTDSLGHINNAVFLSFFEACRVDWLSHMKVASAMDSWNVLPIILARAEIDFLKQVYLEDQVEVRASITHIGNTSFQQVYDLLSPQRGLLARGRAVLVWFDIEKNQKAPIPEAARNFMQQYLTQDKG